MKSKPVLYALVVLFVGLMSFSAYHLVYAKRIIPGIYVGNLRIGGMDFDTALSLVEKTFPEGGDKITLKADGYTTEIDPAELGLKYDWYLTIRRAFEIGRTGNFVTDSRDKLKGLLSPVVINAFYTFDDNLLSQKVSQIKAEVATPAKNAGFGIENGKLVITPSMSGMDLSTSDIYKLIIISMDTLSFGEKRLSLEEDLPEVVEDDLKEALQNAQNLVSTDFYVKNGDQEIALDTETQLSLITVAEEKRKMVLSLDKAAFEAFLAELRLKVDEPPRGRVNEMRNERVLDFEIVELGKSLDSKKFTEDFKTAFFERKEKDNFVEVVFAETESPRDANEYGIFALLGEGNSKFVGSASGRIHNLTLAAERASGSLVPPGQVFSLNEAVGEISGATGYDSAYIITNGRTVLGEGGGVCQTSTTLFRAILNSGLPVVMRYAHAYRVGYYEQDMKPGFDATIFQPSIDLKFRNDTPNYVLIQAAWDTDAKTLQFKIYGTPDGRSVEISEPVVTNVSRPPEPSYQDDPTLPKGTVKQVDFAAWGASVTFTRKVMKDGEVLYEDTFKSNYRPWQAVYLRGTKE
ncbi:MAG: VanW family protein [Patescibacteria group bacterium]